VGIGLLSKDYPGLQVDTLYASSNSTVPTQISTSGSDRILLGKYPGYSAMSIVRFSDLLIGALDTVTILDAHLELKSVYHFGDASAPLAFLGYQITASTDSASYDSLITRPGDYYAPSPILAFPPTTVDDTSTIYCPLDTSVVYSWFTIDGTSSNYGVILIPTNISTIKGFATFAVDSVENYPTLVIDYVKNGVIDSVRYASGYSNFLANADETTIQSSDPLSMFAQCGVAYRAQLNFSVRDSLPKAGLILKAILELTLNSAKSNLNSFAADTLYSYYVYDDSATAPLPILSQSVTSGNDEVYQFALGDYVRTWAKGDSLERLQFAGFRETSSLDLFALYGALSPANVRPRLIITRIAQ